MEGGRKVIVAKTVPTKEREVSNRELWARVCYYYPQYTLQEAAKLSVRDLKLLLKVAQKEKAQDKYDLVQIAAAPHTEKGSGVKKLSEYFRRQMN